MAAPDDEGGSFEVECPTCGATVTEPFSVDRSDAGVAATYRCANGHEFAAIWPS